MSTKYMVETQIKPRGVQKPEVLAAMEAVPRDRFVPAGYKNLAFSDCPLPISNGQTISQPYMVAVMTEMLNIDGNSKVLEIGTGSGYQTAVLSRICREVYSVEVLESLSLDAQKQLKDLGYDNIHFKIGDGHFGWEEHGPYDAIIVTAAPEDVPPRLEEQLKPGARMVIPVGSHLAGQELRIIEKDTSGNITSRRIMAVRFVPLVHG